MATTTDGCPNPKRSKPDDDELTPEVDFTLRDFMIEPNDNANHVSPTKNVGKVTTRSLYLTQFKVKNTSSFVINYSSMNTRPDHLSIKLIVSV